MNRLAYKLLESSLEDVLVENKVDEELIPDIIESVITRLEESLEAHDDPAKEELSFAD